jgi:MarR family transcriptional regulator, organic hydroperoxide resistance regulator
MPLTVSRNELLVQGSDALFRRVIHDALAFSVRLQEIRDGLGASIGLAGPAYSILISIKYLSETGEVGVSRVSDHLHLSGAFVTLEIAKLVKMGLISKTPDPKDGRRVILKITKKAKTLLDDLVDTQRPVNDAIFGGLDREQFQAFAKIISSLVVGTEEGLSLLRFMAEQRQRQA